MRELLNIVSLIARDSTIASNKQRLHDNSLATVQKANFKGSPVALEEPLICNI